MVNLNVALISTLFQDDVKSFCLQIAEDDGEVDTDFPGMHTVSKIQVTENMDDQLK